MITDTFHHKNPKPSLNFFHVFQLAEIKKNHVWLNNFPAIMFRSIALSNGSTDTNESTCMYPAL